MRGVLVDTQAKRTENPVVPKCPLVSPAQLGILDRVQAASLSEI